MTNSTNSIRNVPGLPSVHATHPEGFIIHEEVLVLETVVRSSRTVTAPSKYLQARLMDVESELAEFIRGFPATRGLVPRIHLKHLVASHAALLMGIRAVAPISRGRHRKDVSASENRVLGSPSQNRQLRNS
jgi:hypothetical protein